MPDSQSVVREDTFDLYEFSRTVWQGRWTMVAITAVCVIGAVAYAFSAVEWFTANVVLVQTDDNKSLSGNLAQLGGLASLAGINISGGGESQMPVAVLKSKELVRDFITDKNLTKLLLADKLDPQTGDWKIHDIKRRPDVRDAVEYFQKKVCSITEDKKAGVVTLSITWKNPDVSAEWANELAQRVNTKLRDEATAEAERNIKYLKDEMAAANVTSLQQSIGRVLESEMQKLLLARGNDQFAFKVVDQAVAPRKPTWPRRITIVGGSAVFGILASIAVIILRREVRDRKASAMRAEPRVQTE
jgi:uncharacterized protein involved in exopolysaccharide biosynthesis